MKKTLSLFTLILAVSILSGYKEPVNQTAAKDLKNTGKSDVRESKAKAPEAKPRILFLISVEKNVAPSLWWRYDPSINGQPGC
jgi:hypothetical protein